MRLRKGMMLVLCAVALLVTNVAAQEIKVGFYGPLAGPMSLSGIASGRAPSWLSRK